MKLITKIKQYTSDILNGLATILGGSSTYLAITSPEPAVAAFPAAVTSITASGFYHPKNLDPKTACYGLKTSIFAKGVFALAGLV